jgi:ribonuclease P protein component
MFNSLKRNEIKKIFLEGEKYKGEHITTIVQERNDPLLKFSIIVTGKSKSHERNKIKRRVREIIRSNNEKIKKSKNIVILLPIQLLGLKYQELQKLVLEHFKKIKLI